MTDEQLSLLYKYNFTFKEDVKKGDYTFLIVIPDKDKFLSTQADRAKAILKHTHTYFYRLDRQRLV